MLWIRGLLFLKNSSPGCSYFGLALQTHCYWHGIGSSISFAARPRYLSTSGEWVTVRWMYIDEPSENDWIGVFTPPIDDVYPVNPSEHAPIKWKVTNNLMCAIGYSNKKTHFSEWCGGIFNVFLHFFLVCLLFWHSYDIRLWKSKVQTCQHEISRHLWFLQWRYVGMSVVVQLFTACTTAHAHTDNLPPPMSNVLFRLQIHQSQFNIHPQYTRDC